MNFEKYIEYITEIIELNINRVKFGNFIEDPSYYMSSENIFELTIEEHEKFNDIIETISEENNLKDKFPKKFIFDKLVKEVIVKSYTLESSHNEIKSNLKSKLNEFEKILDEEIKNWTYFIPITGIQVEDMINFESMVIYSYNSFESEILDYLNNENISEDTSDYEVIMHRMKKLKSLCFVKLTVNGTKETSEDKALNKVYGLLSIFSLYKPTDINGFGIMGDVLPLNSELITYMFHEKILNINNKRTTKPCIFNLTKDNITHMKNYHLNYLIKLINKNKLTYFEKCLLNSIRWYYESVKREFNYDEDVAETIFDSEEYNVHHTYFKLGTRIINLVSSLESLLIFNNKTNFETRKERFNLIMNYKKKKLYDYSKDLEEIYKIRNDITHSNKLYNLLKLNIDKNTYLVEMFIMKFIEINSIR